MSTLSSFPTTLVLQGSPAEYTFITDNGRLAVGDHVANRDGLILTELRAFSSTLDSITEIQFLGSNETFTLIPTITRYGLQHVASYQVMDSNNKLSLVEFPIHSALEYIASYADLRQRYCTSSASGYYDYINYGYLANRTVTFDALKYNASNDMLALFGADRVAGALHAIVLYYAWGESSWRANDQTMQIKVVSNGVYALEGTPGNDGLFGLDGDDSLYGGDGSDGLSGSGGNDWLDGGTGADRMAGGSGNDTYIVDNSGDIVDERAYESPDAGGIDTVQSSIRFSLQQSDTVRGLVDNLVLTGSGNLDGTGNSLNNLMIGNLGDNLLNAGAGNDTLDGGAGADRLRGGSGNDAYVVDNANDIVDEGTDGYNSPDAGGIDTVTSSISFSLSDAIHVIGKIEGLALTGTANINASGDDANNVLFGNSGWNTLKGGAGNDILLGEAGNDTLFGGAGNDILTGGAGNDILIGGEGNDTYYFDRSDTAGKDLIIADHDPMTSHDTLVINARADELRFSRTGNDLTIGMASSPTTSGTRPSVTIKNHFLGTAFQVDQIFSSDNKVLTPTAATIMTEMAGFPTVPAGSPILDPRSLLWFPMADKQATLLINAMATMGAPGMNGSALTATNTQAKVEALFAANII